MFDTIHGTNLEPKRRLTPGEHELIRAQIALSALPKHSRFTGFAELIRKLILRRQAA